jgi:hypothetical protein
MRFIRQLLRFGILACCTSVELADATESLHAFATSTTGTGVMGSWAEVADTDLTGLAAADGICRARATAANLVDPDTYAAWLSDRDNDAYCRVFGLSGKKADRCGLASLPIGAGPWLRLDETPFADTIENALDANVVYSPLNVDETGNYFFTPAESFTATDRDGTFITKFDNNPDCERWSAIPAPTLGSTPALGSNLSSSGDWTFDAHGASCSTRQHLICMQKGSGAALQRHSQSGHREAFVTSADVTGDLDGLDGTDAVCQSLAAAANLHQPESFKALVASATFGLGVTDRFQYDGPWYRRDGLLFAHDKAELIGGAVTLPLNVTETGTYLDISVALTGALRDGSPSGFDCNGWAGGADARATGALVNSIAFFANSHEWLSPANVSCTITQPGDWPRKLFCLSDSDVIFHDEFVAPAASL